MNPVERNEILPLGDYEAIRPQFRRRVIEQKRIRRAKLGDHMSIVFENHDTVLLQVQEMLRTERISNEAGIKHELDTYNELVPGNDQLSMTLFVEVAEKEARETLLKACAGMEDHVVLVVDGESQSAKANVRAGATPDRTTAVQYYLIDLSAEAAARLRDGKADAVEVVVDHPGYRASVRLSPEAVAQLRGDLTWSS